MDLTSRNIVTVEDTNGFIAHLDRSGINWISLFIRSDKYIQFDLQYANDREQLTALRDGMTKVLNEWKAREPQ